jgi:hypothetical protein
MFRGFLGLVATLIVVGLLVSVGAGIYQAGVAQGIVDAGRFPAGAAVPVAGVGYGLGFGWHGPSIFGLFFGLLFLFILFGIIRAAFFGGRGRGWGRGGWGHGYGYGPGWGRGEGPSDGDGPRSWREAREQRMADWHKQLHDDEAKGPGGSQPSSSSGSAAG